MTAERGRLERASAERRAAGLADALAAAEPAEADRAALAQLVARARAGDAAATEAVIRALLPLVVAAARRMPTEGLDHEDLVQEGLVGVLRALRRFEADHGVPFAAYASWWVRQALQEARSDFVRPLRLPPKALRQLAQLKSEHQRIYRDEQRSASVHELAERTGIAADQAEALVVADAPGRRVEEPVVGIEGEFGTLGDLLEDPVSAAAYEDVLDSVAGEQLRALLSRLTEREREIVRARFGFDGEPERLVDIAERLGISAERVRQLEERALAKLRHAR
ncbi:MAG TPA: sigma-70 family RNA polymerase sigma factor [Gaiellaceae bacterium]|nr:sigma-70 family RNA polymerase sigma factor [Gaiellaceae bacterium]